MVFSASQVQGSTMLRISAGDLLAKCEWVDCLLLGIFFYFFNHCCREREWAFTFLTSSLWTPLNKIDYATIPGVLRPKQMLGLLWLRCILFKYAYQGLVVSVEDKLIPVKLISPKLKRHDYRRQFKKCYLFKNIRFFSFLWP